MGPNFQRWCFFLSVTFSLNFFKIFSSKKHFPFFFFFLCIRFSGCLPAPLGLLGPLGPSIDKMWIDLDHHFVPFNLFLSFLSSASSVMNYRNNPASFILLFCLRIIIENCTLYYSLNARLDN